MITKEEILDLALLSKLSVSQDELDTLTRELTEIIGFADTINSAAADGEADIPSRLSNVMRSDEAVNSYPREEILANAGSGENGFFPALKK